MGERENDLRRRLSAADQSHSLWRRWVALRDLPELNVAIFALLLNFPWEFLQAPLFVGMAAAPHWEATQICAAAALSDAGLTLIGYWVVSICLRSRRWVKAPGAWSIVGFVGGLVVLNVGIEKVATEQFGIWRYAAAMPVVPVLRVGLLPLLQWLLLPPATVWLVRRQLS